MKLCTRTVVLTLTFSQRFCKVTKDLDFEIGHNGCLERIVAKGKLRWIFNLSNFSPSTLDDISWFNQGYGIFSRLNFINCAWFVQSLCKTHIVKSQVIFTFIDHLSAQSWLNWVDEDD